MKTYKVPSNKYFSRGGKKTHFYNEKYKDTLNSMIFSVRKIFTKDDDINILV
jgi:hypothetical protein